MTIDSISVAPISVLARTGGAGEIPSETKLYFLSSRLRIIMLRVVGFVDKSIFHRCQKVYDTPELKNTTSHEYAVYWDVGSLWLLSHWRKDGFGTLLTLMLPCTLAWTEESSVSLLQDRLKCWSATNSIAYKLGGF